MFLMFNEEHAYQFSQKTMLFNIIRWWRFPNNAKTTDRENEYVHARETGSKEKLYYIVILFCPHVAMCKNFPIIQKDKDLI